MEPDDRVSWQRLVVGPWPFVPVTLFVIGFFAYLNRSVIVAGVSAEGSGEFARILAVLALQGVALAALAVVPLVLLGGGRESLSFRYSRSRVPTRSRYLLGVALAGLIAAVVQFLYRYAAIDDVTGQGVFENAPLAFAVNLVVTTTFAFTASNIAGYASYRIGLQTRQLTRQVSELEAQRRLVVEADQRIRTEVAAALHDDVQGALLRAVLRLNRMAGEVPEASAAGLREVIADLEALRGEGVRAISRRLAPPIASIGLGSALEDLAETYHGSIAVSVHFDDAARAALGGWPDGELAVYRIVEQALLNAGAHGRADSAAVRLTGDDGRVRLAVDDDGGGLAGPVAVGMGLAVVDAWVGILGGTWEIGASASGGAGLVAEIPLSARADVVRA